MSVRTISPQGRKAFKSCHDSVWLPGQGNLLLAKHTNNGVQVKSQQ